MNEHAGAWSQAGAERFAFGENWRRFLAVLSEERIRRAELSLQEMLGSALEGRRFLDVGCGSGLFSLAARRLGADVTSFDYDPESVACARELKRRYFPDDTRWRIAQGSVLDRDFMTALGTFDIVYSWGVLHHTGSLWDAVDMACEAVAAGGQLFIAIYNDQGWRSVWWTRVKRTYNRLPGAVRPAYLLAFGAVFEMAAAAFSVVRLKPGRIKDRWIRYDNVRGMSRWHDVVDWIGGYPFEVATPAAVVSACERRGFTPVVINTCGRRMGCNEFVFQRAAKVQPV